MKLRGQSLYQLPCIDDAAGSSRRLDTYDIAVAAELPLDDPLNDYVEAHIHGGVSTFRDVEAVVIDPTDREAHSATLDRFECAIEVHSGYRVTANSIESDYRGSTPIELARRLGGDITPALLSEAARSGDHDPQAVKWLWHCLARFGTS